MATTDRWHVWCYALRAGWSDGTPTQTREGARFIRDELIEFDGFPPEFVAIRTTEQGAPKRLPPRAVIDRVRAELAAGADR